MTAQTALDDACWILLIASGALFAVHVLVPRRPLWADLGARCGYFAAAVVNLTAGIIAGSWATILLGGVFALMGAAWIRPAWSAWRVRRAIACTPGPVSKVRQQG